MSGITLEQHLANRPATLTAEKVHRLLSQPVLNPEWERKYAEGQLESGIAGIIGMLDEIPAEIAPSKEEARWILGLLHFQSWRGLARSVSGDSNQIIGMQLIEASNKVLGRDAYCQDPDPSFLEAKNALPSV